MNGSRKSRKSKSKEDEGRNRKSERGWVSVTSAITSSEMHLDTVSICQNKAASTAASLMAMDVSDRGVGRGGERHTSLLLHVHTQITHAYTGTTVRTLFLFAANHWYQICTKLQCNSYWTILTFVHERVRVCAFMHPIMLVSVCKRSVCMFTFQLWFLVVRYFPPSLIVMNWVLCQSVIWIVFFSPSSFFSRHFGLSCVHSPFLSLSLSPFLSVLLSLYKKHP